MSEPVAAASPPASSQAVTALVLGILGTICCPFLGPVAWFLSNSELRAIQEARSPKAGEGLATAGKVLGIIGTLWILLFLLWIFFMGGMVVLSHIFSR
ncbi:MAG TPA: DUF4190 domain-containing protein [Thermoanaerobaculia bacterium]|nr:DUF4190 domain-containing protein [Thermoanaerobaculia bacterium]